LKKSGDTEKYMLVLFSAHAERKIEKIIASKNIRFIFSNYFCSVLKTILNMEGRMMLPQQYSEYFNAPFAGHQYEQADSYVNYNLT
jgi:hypothetical protein